MSNEDFSVFNTHLMWNFMDLEKFSKSIFYFFQYRLLIYASMDCIWSIYRVMGKVRTFFLHFLHITRGRGGLRKNWDMLLFISRGATSAHDEHFLEIIIVWVMTRKIWVRTFPKLWGKCAPVTFSPNKIEFMLS